MARRSPKVTKSGTTTVIAVPSAPSAPAKRRRSSSPRRSAPKKRGRRRASSGGGISLGRGGYGNQLIGHGLGGFAVGFIEKTFPNLPVLPIVGKKGAIAIAAYFLQGRHPIIGDIGKSAAAIAGYQLGFSGTITGDGGLAAQM
jgi:hypothetical protein